jgi:hypothetical protein
MAAASSNSRGLSTDFTDFRQFMKGTNNHLFEGRLGLASNLVGSYQELEICGGAYAGRLWIALGT